MAFDVFEEPLEPLLPFVGKEVPSPAGQVLEPAFAVRVKLPLSVKRALCTDPRTERVAVDRVGLRDAGVTMVFGVVEELAKTLLPLGSGRVPSPARQVVKTPFAVSVKPAFGTEVALPRDPVAELVPADRVGLRHTRVTMAFDVVQEQAEPLLPRVREWVPSPTGYVLEAASAVRIELAVGVPRTLRTDHAPSG